MWMTHNDFQTSPLVDLERYRPLSGAAHTYLSGALPRPLLATCCRDTTQSSLPRSLGCLRPSSSFLKGRIVCIYQTVFVFCF